jgi:hypothetical protein
MRWSGERHRDDRQSDEFGDTHGDHYASGGMNCK